MKVNELLFEYFRDNPTKEPLTTRLFTLLLEYWAKEKDFELDNQLLKTLVLKYAAAERELVELNERLLELNQLKNRFLGFAAHDLRNPLISIRGLSDILLSEATGKLTEEQKEFLATINTAGTEMLALVNDLLDISVIESGKIELHIAFASLEQVIKQRVRMNRILAEEKQISFHQEYGELARVPMDVNRIGQVIDNLLGNALKFSPVGSNIFISTAAEGGMARVSVRDEGPGIAEEDQQRVFGEFQRIRVSPAAGEKGTGLGLAIAKRIVEAHRGTLQVESQNGAGSTFSFAIPMEDYHGANEPAQGADRGR
jgi:two-component system, sensor histidine kinase and response regulator